MIRIAFLMLRSSRGLFAVGAAVTLAGGALAQLPAAPAQSSAAVSSTTVEPVVVVGHTPVPGTGLPLQQIPFAVKTLDSDAIARAGGASIADAMNAHLAGVNLNEIHGNAYQPDLNFRGFTASPLLGTPQGLALYVDGVRFNQPFADIVSWDLIPQVAIADLAVLPGSNPLFGLNTLGGAITVQSKDGREFAGSSLRASLGSAARRQVEMEHGGQVRPGRDSLHWYLAGHFSQDDGWRVNSASRVGQLFAKVGARAAGIDWKLALAHAESRLNGNGLQDFQHLARDWQSVYTQPDITRQRSTGATLNLVRALSDQSTLSGVAYLRRQQGSTYNGDVNEGALDQSVYQPNASERAALAAAGYRGFPVSGENAGNTPFPFWRCVGQALLRDEPGEKCNALINTTATTQTVAGGALQWTTKARLAGFPHQLTAGATLDVSRVQFSQQTQLAYLNADRSVTPVAAWADGVRGGDVDGVPFDNRVQLSGRGHTLGLFVTDTVSIRDNVFLTASGRFDQVTIHNRDQIRAPGSLESLDGDHRFRRFKPSLGVSWSPSPTVNLFANLSESGRTPTAIELGCANPDRPCKLPNAMAGDPPLRQVLARTVEVGVRGGTNRSVQWSLGAFSTDSRDDILFVADNQSGYGYFRNFGHTRRTGFDAEAAWRAGPWRLAASYAWLKATFQSPEVVNGSANSSNEAAQNGQRGLEGTIEIRPGDRLPLLPQHVFKLALDYAPGADWLASAQLLAQSGSTARGNENGLHQPDGRYYLGNGRVPGFAVLNFALRYQATARLRLGARINNVLDTRYSTAAQLGPTAFTAAGAFQARPFGRNADGSYSVQSSTFLAPGAPRLFAVELHYAW